ncbi:MAG: Planctomycete cytochrome [Verrucomicrobia bacterium]|nr:Planctomycete cytochrome [Verrucomicrobiota bacterium]
MMRHSSRPRAIIPGNPDKSLLIRAIRHTDPDLKMPKEKLPEKEIAVLEEWVKRGATDPRVIKLDAKPELSERDWWSLKPLQAPPVPASKKATHPIDAFIRVKLRENKLSAAPQADRRTLIRRLYFDLIGLPPTPEEVDAFIADEDPRAWNKLVDRLLASPRYGERWARHWLDTIHYADTHGFEHDRLRTNAWRYRDYVIESFNRDTPWPRFIREQLAADALFPEKPELTVALGFLGAGPYDESAAGTALQSFEYIDRDDLVTQTMAAFASTTANCARCHAHKFDPITQEDYFALQAVFAGIGKGDVSFDGDTQIAAQRRQWQGLKSAVQANDREVLLAPADQALVREWEKQGKVGWKTLSAELFLSAEGATLYRRLDGSIVSAETRPDRDIVTVTGTPELRKITAIKLELLPDETLPQKGPGRNDNGNLHLTEIEAQVLRPAVQPELLKFRRASADFDQKDWTSAHAIDGNLKTAWGIFPEVGKPHHAVFELDRAVNIAAGDKLVVTLKQLHGGGHVIGRFRLAVTDAPVQAAFELPAHIEAALAIPPEQRGVEQLVMIAAVVLQRRAEYELGRLPAPAKVYAAAARAENERGLITYAEPRVIRVLHRGDLANPRAEVKPGSLSAIAALKSRFEIADAKNESARRAALADWLADERNPLTWRSAANRVWQYHFGRGLCDTPSDFGRMGGVPSHPELLDWLAAELREYGGSIKHLHRLICTSQTYSQTSDYSKKGAAVDPDNRLLWRMNSQRLDADGYRDAVLAVSGRLDLKMGGPGVPHFNASGAVQNTPTLDYKAFDWSTPSANRRSIYRIVWRGIPDPFMEALDFPDSSLLAPTRSFSASALQALSLLNNEFVLHHSEHFAKRIASSSKTTREQIRAAFRLVLLREPTKAEYSEFGAIAQRHGLAAVGRVLFNSNEFLFVN